MNGIRFKALLLACVALLFFAALWPALARAQEVSIERFLICRGISQREPVEPTALFSLADGKAFAFAELTSAKPGRVTFVFFHGVKEKASVTLPYKPGHYRLWGSKQFAGLKGTWKVELRNSEGKVLGAVSFRVE